MDQKKCFFWHLAINSTGSFEEPYAETGLSGYHFSFPFSFIMWSLKNSAVNFNSLVYNSPNEGYWVHEGTPNVNVCMTVL